MRLGVFGFKTTNPPNFRWGVLQWAIARSVKREGRLPTPDLLSMFCAACSKRQNRIDASLIFRVLPEISKGTRLDTEPLEEDEGAFILDQHHPIRDFHFP